MNAATRRTQRLALAGLVVLLPLSLAAFGAVHEPARLALALGLLVAGLAASWSRIHLPRELAWFAVLGLGWVGLDALVHGVAVGPGPRSLAQPGVAGLVERGLEVAGVARHPLALAPREHAIEQVFTLGLLAAVVGTASVVDRSLRAWFLAVGLVGTGVVFGLVGVLQEALGAGSIYGVSGFGEGQRFFGTLINANHAGALCAALIPWAVALVRTARQGAPLVALSAVLLALGVWASGSRGAVVVAVVAVVAVAGFDRDVRVRRVGWALAAAAIVALFGIGPVTLFEWLTAAVEPGRHYSHALDSGRSELYAEVLRLVPSVPGGVGVGGFEEAYHLVKSSPSFSTANQAHSDGLQAWIERGPLGLVGLGFSVVCWLAGWWSWRTASPDRQALIGGALASVLSLWLFAAFDFPAAIGSLALLQALSHGALLGLWAAEREESHAGPVRGALVAALLLGLLGAGWAVVHPKVGPLLEVADRAVADGRLEDAEAALMRVLTERPVHQPAVVRLARVRLAKGQAAEARELLGLAGELWPTHPVTWLTLARLERGAGDDEAAAEAWRRVLALDLPEAGETPLLAEALRLEADPLAAAGRVLPERADRWCQAAGVAASTGDRSTADALYGRAVAMDRRCALFQAHWLARTYRAEQALPLVADAPESCDGYRVKGRVMLGVGRTEEAVALFEKSLASCATDDVWIRFMLARSKVDLGDEASLDTMARIAERHPHSGRSRVVYRYMGEAGRDAEAMRWLGRLVASGEATEAEKARWDRLGKPVNGQRR